MNDDQAAEPAATEIIADKIEIPMPFVVLATPSSTGWCSMEHRDSMIETTGLLVQRGVPHAIIDRKRQLYLDLVRDMLFSSFLKDFPQATDLFFIDDDVGFPAEKVLQFLIRPEPVLAGI